VDTDTIFALSSGSGASGIAVIRVTGAGAIAAAEALVGSLPAPRRVAVRDVRDPATGEKIDSGVILFFRGPRSFTGEDLVEFQVHGSIAVIRALLGVLGRMPGLRLAEAGEFTGRAFENGKLDLIEVEALGDLLAAETMAQARLAQHYHVRLREAAAGWRGRLLDCLALTEAYIDFSDEGDIQASGAMSADPEIAALTQDIRAAMDGLSRSERIRRGFRVAILGPPNAGKSSLLNALASRDVAIVSPVAGTTRDLIEVHLDLDGWPVVVIDTAGLHETDDVVEQAGISRARRAAGEADLRIWVTRADMFEPAPYEDCLNVGTMIDLFDSLPTQRPFFTTLSSHTGERVGDLIHEIKRRAGLSLNSDTSDHVMVAHERQKRALGDAAASLERCMTFQGGELELRAEELRQAVNGLDRLVGRIDHEDVLGAIFSRFCVGK
jgi:tRNA modification GTPase